MSEQSKYAKRLDKSRDYGSVHPADRGVFFIQDGFPFNFEGYIVDDRLADFVAEKTITADQVAALKPAKVKAAVAKPAAAPKPPKPNGGEGGGGESGSKEGEHDDGLNLTMWLTGEEEYPFEQVRAAVKARYSVFKTSKPALVLFLVEEQQLVAPDKLSDEFKQLVGENNE